MMKVDFHMHTHYSSDSLTKPQALVRKAKSLGIIPAITDHNTIAAHAELRGSGAQFIPGEGIFTDSGDLIGLYLSKPIKKNTQFLEAIDQIHSQGGIAYLPHMFDYGRSGKHASAREAAKVDVVEAFNARCMSQRMNRQAWEFAEKHKLLKGAGSDSHFLFEFGSTYTELPDFDLDNPSSLLKALRKSKLVTKQAPFFVRGTTKLIYIGKKISKIGVAKPI